MLFYALAVCCCDSVICPFIWFGFTLTLFPLFPQPCHPIFSSWSQSFLQPSVTSSAQTVQGAYRGHRCLVLPSSAGKCDSQCITDERNTKCIFFSWTESLLTPDDPSAPPQCKPQCCLGVSSEESLSTVNSSAIIVISLRSMGLWGWDEPPAPRLRPRL